MVKKKVLILSTGLGLGGVEKSLLGLLMSFDYDRYEVYLYLTDRDGELMSEIPDMVHILPEISGYSIYNKSIINVFKQGNNLMAIARLYAKVKTILYKVKKHDRQGMVELLYSYKYTFKLLPNIPGDYDVVLSFITPHYIASHKVNAKIKLAWIHTDYSVVDLDIDSELDMWNRFDWIIAISESVADSYLKVFPELDHKIIVIKNILPIKYVQEKAASYFPSFPGKARIQLLSIGRFCYAKNFESIPRLCFELRENGLDIDWNIIGYGNAKYKNMIKTEISKYNIQDYVHLLGKISNPYPYIANCDYYVQPSRYEGNSVAVREAQILNIIPIISKYRTSDSQVIDGVDGYIFDEDINKAIPDLLAAINGNSNPEIINKLICSDYSNQSEIFKLYELIDGDYSCNAD